MDGDPIDIRAVTGESDAYADGSGVPHAGALLAFTDSVVKRDAARLAADRDVVREAVGPGGLVDTAATVGSFQRMTRIADATGIPVDAPVNILSAEIQDELNLRRFSSASVTSKPNALAASLARRARPLLFRLARKLVNRAGH